jgi:hypothetical protein
MCLAPTSGATGRYRPVMIGGEQGGEERFIARQDLTGVDLVSRLHGSSPGI